MKTLEKKASKRNNVCDREDFWWGKWQRKYVGSSISTAKSYPIRLSYIANCRNLHTPPLRRWITTLLSAQLPYSYWNGTFCIPVRSKFLPKIYGPEYSRMKTQCYYGEAPRWMRIITYITSPQAMIPPRWRDKWPTHQIWWTSSNNTVSYCQVTFGVVYREYGTVFTEWTYPPLHPPTHFFEYQPPIYRC